MTGLEDDRLSTFGRRGEMLNLQAMDKDREKQKQMREPGALERRPMHQNIRLIELFLLYIHNHKGKSHVTEILIQICNIISKQKWIVIAQIIQHS